MKPMNKPTVSVDLAPLSEAERRQWYETGGTILRQGGTVVFPTETVYGLGANALDPLAVRGIYEAKGRPSDNPLIIHVADEDLSGIVRDIPPMARLLMDRYWPGPLTLVLRKDPRVPDETTGGLDTVGVRMPESPAALELIRAAGVPVAAPSANVSGRPSPTNLQRCIQDLAGRVDLILGLDQSRVGLESTIVDLTGDVPELLRPGAVTLEELREILGPVRYEPSVSLEADEAPRAPGMKYRHYAPKARVTIFRGPIPAVRAQMLAARDSSTLLLFIDEAGGGHGPAQADELARPEAHDRSLVRYGSPAAAARDIFERLRLADDDGYAAIWIQAVAETGLGRSLMNRLNKAAAYESVEVKG